MVELVAEEVFYFAATKLARRQADIVDDQKRDARSIRTRPEIRRRGPAGEGNPPGFAKRISIGTGGGRAFGKTSESGKVIPKVSEHYSL